MNRELQVKLTTGRIIALALGLLVLLACVVGLTFKLSLAEHEHEAPGAKAKEDGAHGGEEPGHQEGRVQLSPAALEKAGLQILTAGPGKVAVTLALPGEISVNADTLAHVTPRVGGTVRSVSKQLGDRVTKGESLALLDSRELAEARREVQSSKERLSLAQANFARQEKLWNEKVSAEKDFLTARQALAEAQIDHRGALQKLGAIGGGGAGSAGSSYTLIAPLDGTIIEKHISIGEVLKDDTQAFVIADLSTLWVEVTVYARDLSKIKAGQLATIKAEGIAASARGTIVYVGQVVGEDTRSATARVVLDNPGAAWRPGLFVTAEVTIDEADVPVTVVDDGVQTVEGKPVVFVQEGDAFQARPIKIGRKGSHTEARTSPLVEVLDGLAAGARYVGNNSFILKAELGKSEAGHED